MSCKCNQKTTGCPKDKSAHREYAQHNVGINVSSGIKSMKLFWEDLLEDCCDVLIAFSHKSIGEIR